jgi:putative transposase
VSVTQLRASYIDDEGHPFLHLESRRVSVAGITRHPDQEWMQQIARSATQETWGYLDPCRYVLHDRDTKFCASFRSVLAACGVKSTPLPARSPNLNAFAKRWVRSAKEECLSKLILFGERLLTRTLAEFSAHYHGERNHQGRANKLLFPEAGDEPLPATWWRVASGSEAYSSTMAAPHE